MKDVLKKAKEASFVAYPQKKTPYKW